MNAKRFLSILLSLLMVGIYIPAASAATGVNSQGRTVAEVGDQLFVAVTAANGTSLNRVPLNGGDLVNVEAQTNIEDLVSVGDTAFYLRYDPPAYQIVSSDKDGKLSILNEFEDQEVMKLSYYDGILYCIVDGVLTLIDPEGGDPEPLNPEVKMLDYVIVNDVIYYISETDTKEYTATNGDGDAALTATDNPGRLYSMSITGSNSELMEDIGGVRDLKAYGNYVYFHNYDDNYLTSSAEGQAWMEGKLYRMNTETNQIASMSLNYDWDYYVTQYGVVVYTSGDISLYPLAGGAAKKLMSPGSLTMVSAAGGSAYAYDYDKNSLTQIPLQGGSNKTLVSGAKITDAAAKSPTTAPVEYEVDENGDLITDENGNPIPVSGTGAEDAPGEDAKTPALPKSDGYIFPNSATEKLTMEEIRKVDGSLWELGRMEILARHGYEFNTNSVQEYFDGKTWYTRGGYRAGMLDAIETYNNTLLKRLTGGVLGRSTDGTSSSSSSSGKTGGYIFPSSKTKKLTRSQILNVSKSKWGYGRNEILARHGYQFQTKKYRDYFGGKSWYDAGGYSQSSLNSTEWYNMDLIKSLEKEYGLLDDDGKDTSPSSSSGRIKLSKNVFSNSSTTKLKKSQLEGLSANKLATARNEILARHGYPFKQSKWVNYFKAIGWKARSSYSYGKLNATEKYNVELIKKYE